MTISEILRVAPQATDVLKRLGIVHLNSKAQFEEACREAQVLPELVKEHLKKILISPSIHSEMSEWPLPHLVEHMMEEHHRFIKESVKSIRTSIHEVLKQYGSRRIELEKIKSLFDKVVIGLELHIYTEGKILFPAIKKLAEKRTETNEEEATPFHLMYPIETMENEHRAVIADLDKIRALTRGYKVPKGTISAFGLLYSQLEQLEKHIKYIVKLEDQILYPAALQLESGSSNDINPLKN